MATHLALAFNAIMPMVLSSTGGCTTSCTQLEERGTVTSGLSYTEPVAATGARDARIEAATDPPERLAAEKARGTARVVAEARAFDGTSLGRGATQLSVTSTVTFSATIVGSPVPLSLSTVVLRLDAPTVAGTTDLSVLNATVCETVITPHHDGSDTYEPACGPAAGSLSYQPGQGTDFDGDLTLTAPATPGNGPVLSGTAHLHYEARDVTSTCLDVGRTPGLFSP